MPLKLWATCTIRHTLRALQPLHKEARKTHWHLTRRSTRSNLLKLPETCSKMWSHRPGNSLRGTTSWLWWLNITTSEPKARIPSRRPSMQGVQLIISMSKKVLMRLSLLTQAGRVMALVWVWLVPSRKWVEHSIKRRRLVQAIQEDASRYQTSGSQIRI